MSFSYDANGRMVKATKPSVPDALSVYDASGLRVAEYVNDIWRFMIFDIGGKLVAEYGGLQSTDEGGVKYVLSDWQGSTRGVVSNTGNVQSRSDYTSFGEQIESGTGLRSASQGFGKSGGLKQGYALTEKDDATGLDHTWFRKNENQAGRWTSPDPYNGSMALGNPQSFNRYSYVENQPTNFIDPSGLNEVAYYVDGFLSDARTAWAHINGGGGYINFHSAGGITVINSWEQRRGANEQWEYRNFTQRVHVWGGNFGTWDDWIIGGQIDTEKVKVALDKCLRDMFNLSLTHFSASERGKNGSVTVNSTNERRFNGLMGFGVVNDVTSFNSVQIGTIGGGGEDNGITAVGMAPSADGTGFVRYSPHINYTANNLTNSMAILGAQIHELGHSLAAITGIQPQVPSKSRRPGGADSATAFEQCVFGGEVGRNGRILK